MARPREQQLSSLFQVAGSTGQSSPPGPPGKEPLLFACAFTPLFSEGERVQLAITQPTRDFSDPAAAGKGGSQSAGLPAQTLWRCLFLASSGVWVRFLSVSSVGSPSQGGVPAGRQGVAWIPMRLNQSNCFLLSPGAQGLRGSRARCLWPSSLLGNGRTFRNVVLYVHIPVLKMC